jgi:hypothetical protein
MLRGKKADNETLPDASGRVSLHLATLVSVSESFMDQALTLAHNFPSHWQKVLDGTLTVGNADDLAHGRDPARRKHNKGAASAPDATAVAIPAWEVPKPKTRNLVDWQQAFNAQQQRARALFDQIAVERQKRIAAEGSIPNRARALSLKDIGAIKKQAADDVALMRRRCLLAASYLAGGGTVLWGPHLAAETKMNMQQWQAFVREYRDAGDALAAGKVTGAHAADTE